MNVEGICHIEEVDLLFSGYGKCQACASLLSLVWKAEKSGWFNQAGTPVNPGLTRLLAQG